MQNIIFWASVIPFWIACGYEVYQAIKWKKQAQKALDNNKELIESFNIMVAEFNKLSYMHNLLIDSVKANPTKEIE